MYYLQGPWKFSYNFQEHVLTTFHSSEKQQSDNSPLSYVDFHLLACRHIVSIPERRQINHSFINQIKPAKNG